MKKKITVLTSTRAEYGLLRPVMIGLRDCDSCVTEVVATGAHLSPAFGLTYREIENDGIEIAEKIAILSDTDSPCGVSKVMALATMRFADYFEASKPDLLVVLGDRYETLAVCCAAVNARIPIAHLHGGETTEGAIDESYRHAITKMSDLHFTATETYRKRVIQLGEEPNRVFNVGAIGVENALHLPLLSKQELEARIGVSLDRPYACVTFHPVTREEDTAKTQTEALLRAIDAFPDRTFIFTKANADADGRSINRMLDAYVKKRENAFVFASLGIERYLSAVKHAEMVIGNSSSGLIEAPSFHIPTVNIGDRQKGRIRSGSVIDCRPEKDDIIAAIRKAQSAEFRAVARAAENPYGDGKTSGKIVRLILEALQNGIDRKKKFYDVDFEVKQ